MSYSLFVALRYLKGKHKSAPLSINTLISIGGVALGVAAAAGVGRAQGLRQVRPGDPQAVVPAREGVRSGTAW